jgi:hypothetical protein
MGNGAPPDPLVVDPGANGVDRAGHLTAGHHRQVGDGVAPSLAAADGRVDEMHAGGLDGDAHLTLGRNRIGALLVQQALRRSELVLPDRVHRRLSS